MNRFRLASNVASRVLFSSLPDGRGFRNAYLSALSSLEDPLKKWTGASMEKGPLFTAYDNLDEYESKAIRLAVKDAVQREHGGGGAFTAYRYNSYYVEDRDDWGGFSMTTDPRWVVQFFDRPGLTLDEGTVRSFEVRADDIMLHWAMQMPNGWFTQWPLVSDEREIILHRDAKPREIPVDQTPLAGDVEPISPFDPYRNQRL